MTIFLEKYKGHDIYFHTITCIYTCKAIGERISFYVMSRAIDSLNY